MVWAREEADAKKMEIKLLEEQLGALKADLIALKGERESLQMRLTDSAPRSAADDARTEANVLHDQVSFLYVTILSCV